MSKHIYIVEDEAIVALETKRALHKLGYSVSGMSSNYDDALKGIQQTSPDLILMDITLKYSKSGIEIAKKLQETHFHIPIIFLTSVTDTSEMQEAIDTNPSNYLLKPFRREELYSAILLALHKASKLEVPQKAIVPLCNGYTYDPEEKLLFYGQEHISLGKKECHLLKILIEAKGEVVSFKVLEALIWEGEAVGQSAFRTLRYRLNQKLKHKLIESIPYYGCRLLCNAS
jgi:DNA-binding response OmpR family regulator